MTLDRRLLVIAIIWPRCRWIATETGRRGDSLNGLTIWRPRRKGLWELVLSRRRTFPRYGKPLSCSPWGKGETYIIVRGSLRMRSFTPWSANERERKVDSIIPGKFLGGDTGEVSSAQQAPSRREFFLPLKRSEMMVFRVTTFCLTSQVSFNSLRCTEVSSWTSRPDRSRDTLLTCAFRTG